jgi:predicted  nucleic acid-binding Zn-ribbon protein
MLTPNNVNDAFQSQLERPATPYEVTKYATAPISTLSSLKTTYGKLNTTSSISDYLTSVGQDSSMKNRQALALQHGIQGYAGSAEANTALLEKLRGGSTPPAPQQAPQGSVGAAAGTPVNPWDNNPVPQTITQGRLSDAAPPQQYPQADPQMEQINQQVTSAQSAYNATQKQISDIDLSLSKELEAKKAQIVASGGIVNEAQLRGLVSAEQAPLIAQRKDLAAQMSQQGSVYKQLQSSQKSVQDQAYKQQQLAEKKAQDATKASEFAQKEGDVATKEADANAKFGITTQQKQETLDLNAQKASAGQWKVVSTPINDAYGKRMGTAMYRVNAQTGEKQPLTTDARGALTSQSIHALTSGDITDAGTKSAVSIQAVSSPSYIHSFTVNGDAPTDENQGIKVPGTNLTVGALYQSALDWMAKPVTNTNSSNKPSADKAAAISAKGAAILKSLGINKIQYEAATKANEAALSNNMKQYGLLSVNEKAATANFKTLIGLAKKADIQSTNVSPYIETWVRGGKISATGNPDLNNFTAQLVLTLNEYAKVIAGQSTGGAVSDAARTETAKLISPGMTADEIRSFYDNVASKDISNRLDASRGAIQDLVGGIASGTPGVAKDDIAKADAPQVIAPEKIPSGYYQASDGLLYKK